MDVVIKAYLNKIDESDVFVGIYGAFHGFMVPSPDPPFGDSDYSYLELEFRTADEQDKPIIAFVQRVQGRDEELGQLLPLIVKRHKAYWFNTGKDLVPNVLDGIEELLESGEEPAGDDLILESGEAFRPKVFLSYASEDVAFARRLFDSLREASIDVWFDKKSLLPGQKWKSAIKEAIRDSRFFIALLSNNSVNKKGYVQKELKEAIDQLDEYPATKVFLIPARIDDCKPLEERLGDLHWVDMFPDYDDGLSRILTTIKSQA